MELWLHIADGTTKPVLVPELELRLGQEENCVDLELELGPMF